MRITSVKSKTIKGQYMKTSNETNSEKHFTNVRRYLLDKETVMYNTLSRNITITFSAYLVT